ncbi:hypothetical protein [Aneurinibacillus sp. REN35]|uniref:hypothetical protein n=1 Tax=Aneurinibacillus sp. REN35 TaxID=3237286 RepID=UPI00352761BC
MSRCSRPHCPPAKPIVQDPKRVYRDFYHPQTVPVIQPIEIINRHHCVPVYQHSYCYKVKNEFCGNPSCHCRHHKKRHH